MAMVTAGCMTPGLGRGEIGPGDVGECVSLVPATVSILGMLPVLLWAREVWWVEDSMLSRRKPTFRGAGASMGAARDGVGEDALF